MDCMWGKILNLLLKWKCLKNGPVMPQGLSHVVLSSRIRNFEWEPDSCRILEPRAGGERCVAIWDRVWG